MRIIFFSALMLCASLAAVCQLPAKLKLVKDLGATSVKNQCRTGTCWDFATVSFIESEMIRQGKAPLDLSEMYIVRYTYEKKAKDYVRFEGKANLGEGGQAHDVLNVVRAHGLVPKTVYTGLIGKNKEYDHTELLASLEKVTSKIVKAEKKRTSKWADTLSTVIESYLGKTHDSIDVDGRKMTPLQYSKDVVGFDPDQYVEITSYSHHPFYSKFAIEIPDNWSHDLYWNLPMEDMMAIIDKSLDMGYTVCWDGDVSETGFKHNKGLAKLPDNQESGGVTQEMRQSTFEDGSTTDDHLMHITGYATDENGVKYYKTKNSWNEKSNSYGGYVYLSAAYTKLKTIAILVHKDVVPDDIKAKMKLL